MGKTVFQENVVIITGASLGIGRELAFQLAGQGPGWPWPRVPPILWKK